MLWRFHQLSWFGALSIVLSSRSPAPSRLSFLGPQARERGSNCGGYVPFREIVGCLMWIANQTRPDIVNAVRAIARFLHDPKEAHYRAAHKILGYLKSTAA